MSEPTTRGRAKVLTLLFPFRTCSELLLIQGKASSRASAPPTTQRLDFSSIPGMDTGSPAFFRSMALASKRARAEKDTPSSSGSSSAARTAHRLFPDGGLLDYSA